MKSVRVVSEGIVVKMNGDVPLTKWAQEVIRFLNTTDYHCVKCEVAGYTFAVYKSYTIKDILDAFSSAVTTASDIFHPHK